MNAAKAFMAVMILAFSGQAMALFLPEGSHSVTDRGEVINDLGC
jgi:hypothetical protein